VAFAAADQPETFGALLDLINAYYGLSLGPEDVAALGKSILKDEREFNIAAGLGPADDRLPGFMKKDPLPPHNIVFKVTDEDLDKVYNW
jgi:aldehyde:ferredoxin oxidoreductase